MAMFVEVGPGKVLAGLLRQIDRSVHCVNVEDSATLQKTIEKISQARAEVADLAELSRLDELTGEPDRRHEAVVEAAEVLDARRGDPRPDFVGLLGGAAERLLAGNAGKLTAATAHRVHDLLDILHASEVGSAEPNRVDPRVGDHCGD